MAVINRAPEWWSEEQKKEYRRAAWRNIWTSTAEGAATGAGIGATATAGAAAIPGAVIGGLLGLGKGLFGASDERARMRGASTVALAEDAMAADASRKMEAAQAAEQKAAKRGAKSATAAALKGDMDVLAQQMPASGVTGPHKEAAIRRSEFGWG